MTPRKLLRTLSAAEAVTWLLLITAMWLKYGPVAWPGGVAVAGSMHGVVFLGYVWAVILIAIDRRLSIVRTAALGIASIIPFATLATDLVAKRGQWVLGGWRDRRYVPRPTTPRSEPGAATPGTATDPAPGTAAVSAQNDDPHPLVEWARLHPATQGATALLVFAMILTNALAHNS